MPFSDNDFAKLSPSAKDTTLFSAKSSLLPTRMIGMFVSSISSLSSLYQS